MQAEGGRVPLITFNWLMEREERPRTDGCAAAFPPVSRTARAESCAVDESVVRLPATLHHRADLGVTCPKPRCCTGLVTMGRKCNSVGSVYRHRGESATPGQAIYEQR